MLPFEADYMVIIRVKVLLSLSSIACVCADTVLASPTAEVPVYCYIIIKLRVRVKLRVKVLPSMSSIACVCADTVLASPTAEVLVYCYIIIKLRVKVFTFTELLLVFALTLY